MGRSIPLSLATGNPPVAGALLMQREAEQPADLHRSVMLDEIVQILRPVPQGVVVDATVGLGGHTEALLEAMPQLRIVGIDRDAESLELADLRLARWSGRYELTHSDFRQLPELAMARGWAPLAGVIVDLGVSSLQLERDERGFSFRREGPLDMRMDRRQKRTAAVLVNRLPYPELRSMIRDYGEDRQASRIARAIVEAREQAPIISTLELARVILEAVPQRGPQRIHPATRTFQALRIAVNDELTGLYEFVLATARLLIPGGRLAVVAFHSLEDRLIKRALRYLASDCECPPEIPRCVCDKRSEAKILTRRPLYPSEAEIAANPRARSARLRALEKN